MSLGVPEAIAGTLVAGRGRLGVDRRAAAVGVGARARRAWHVDPRSCVSAATRSTAYQMCVWALFMTGRFSVLLMAIRSFMSSRARRAPVGGAAKFLMALQIGSAFGLPAAAVGGMRFDDYVPGLPTVYVASSPEEREAIFGFRYQVYVRELGRELGHVDHARRMVHDAEDDRPYTTLLYCRDGDAVTGTLRVSHWAPGQVPEREWNKFSMRRFDGLRELRTAELGRLMSASAERGQLVCVALVAGMYQLLVESYDTDVMFASCPSGLVSRYLMLGLRVYGGCVVATPDGVEVPLVGIFSDRAYPASAGSFLVPFIDAAFGPGRRALLPLEGFARVLDPDGAPIELRPAAVLRELLARRAEAEGRHGHFLGGLNAETMERLAEEAVILKVPAGALVSAQGRLAREAFVVLEGAVLECDRRRHVMRGGAGEVIGASALLGSSGRRRASIHASIDTELLVIRHRHVQALMEGDPACAADLLCALARSLADEAYG
jgi:hypothetical protein